MKRTGSIRVVSLVLTIALAAGIGRAAEKPSENPTLLEQAFALDEEKDGKRDAAGAAGLYRRAAEAGDAFAHLRLGYLCETGNGVPQDYAAARAHYQAAVDAGLMAARVRLAICHLEGWGGAVDRAAFVQELKIAGDAGELEAQRILARIYFLGFGVPEDRAEGLRWLELAAKQDDASAQYVIGRKLESDRAKALLRDMSASRNWYSLSAEKEYQASMRAMARTFLFAPRAERNWQVAYQWLQLASEANDPEAPYVLAFAELIHPDAPTRDEAKARNWLELAKARGNPRAKEVLELAASGKTLTESMRYTLNVAGDDRYVDATNRSAGQLAGPVRPPRLIRAIRPAYPQALRLADVEGKVEVDFVVDRNGKVIEPKVVKSGHPLMSEAALAAIAQWEFHPAEKDGVPINAKMRLPLQFDMKAETLDGLDGLLGAAAGQAEKKGLPSEDYRELRLAKFLNRPAPPTMTDGEPLPADRRALLIVCVDATGRPLRSHVLSAEPATVGPPLSEWVLRQDFQPRLVDGKAVASNVVFVHAAGTYRPGK